MKIKLNFIYVIFFLLAVSYFMAACKKDVFGMSVICYDRAVSSDTLYEMHEKGNKEYTDFIDERILKGTSGSYPVKIVYDSDDGNTEEEFDGSYSKPSLSSSESGDAAFDDPKDEEKIYLEENAYDIIWEEYLSLSRGRDEGVRDTGAVSVDICASKGEEVFRSSVMLWINSSLPEGIGSDNDGMYRESYIRLISEGAYHTRDYSAGGLMDYSLWYTEEDYRKYLEELFCLDYES